MMKRILLLVSLVLSCCQLFGQDGQKGSHEPLAQDEFLEIADRLVANKIYFRWPEGSIPVAQVEQYDVRYDLAYRIDDEDVECRISYHSLEEFPLTQDSAERSVYMMLYVMCLNIAQDEDFQPEIKSFNDEYLNDVFNADFGYMVLCPGDSMFSADYKYTLITAFHKEGQGTIYNFVLSDALDDLEAVWPDIQKYITSSYFFKYEDRPF